MTAVLPEASGLDGGGRLLTVFGWLWSWAALFHVVGNARLDDVLLAAPVGVATLVTAVLALAVLLRPEYPVIGALAASVVVTAVLEAPVLGNHWFLAAATSTVLLVALVVSGRDMEVAAHRFVPAAASLLLVSYAAAAFAKLNTAFLDPSVSCAVVYAEQLLGSWGFGLPDTVIARQLAIWSTILIELSVPVLLSVRRTRQLGVVVGVAFHGFIALDLAQHFWDFSSVLIAAFVLFSSPTTVGRLARTLDRPLVRRLAVLVWLPPLVAAAVPQFGPLWALGRTWTQLLWLGYLAVAIWVLAHRRTSAGSGATDGSFRLLPRGAWLVVPLLALVNVATPYLELKTGYSLVMYSNLHAANGASNHVLLERTWPIGGRQGDLVEVMASEDPGLAVYVDSGYLLPWTEFRHRLGVHPELRTRYRRGDEDLVWPETTSPPVSELAWRFAPLRAVDATSPTRCQTVWLPAH